MASKKWGQLKNCKYDLNIIKIVLFKDNPGWPGERTRENKQWMCISAQNRESHVAVFPPGQPERCSGAEKDCLPVSPTTTALRACGPPSTSRLRQREMV